MDFRVNTEMFDHPKFKKLQSVTGNDGLSWLMRLWRYATIYFPDDGRFVGMSTDSIRDVLRSVYDQHQEIDPVSALVESGWLDIDGDTIKAHDWEDWQTWVCGRKHRSESAKKAVNSRYNKKISRTTRRIRGVGQSNTVRTTPSPSPSPLPSPTPIVVTTPVERWLEWRKSEAGQKKLRELLALTRSDQDQRPRLTETEFREALKDKEQWIRDHATEPRVFNRKNWGASASAWMKIAYERKKERESRSSGGFTTNLSDRDYDAEKLATRGPSTGGFVSVGELVKAKD